MALTGNETLQVLGQTSLGNPAAETQQTTTGAIAALASTESSPIVSTAITTVGNGTLTAAGLVGGQIVRTGPVANYSDATDTAAAIVAAVPGYILNETFLIRIKNGTAFTQTITAGTGVTLPPTVIIPAFSVGNYYAQITSPTAVTLVHMGTTPIATGTNLTALAITTVNTVGAGTLLAANFVGGYTSRTGSQSGTPFTDTTDTAAAIIAASANIVNKIGTSFIYVYGNTTNAIATITGGTGVTVSGVTSIPAGMVAQYLVTYTATATLTMVGIGITNTVPTAMAFLGSSSGETILQPSAAASGTLTLPAATDTLVGKATTDTLTNKTLTAPIIGSAGATFNGSGSGTTALAASATAAGTLTLPAVTGTVASTTGANLFVPDLKRCSGSVTVNGSTTYVNVTGLSFTVVPGTYEFVCRLPSTVASGTGGIKYAFNYTTTVVSSIQATGRGFTSAAVAVQQTTTTTTQTDIFTQAAVVIYTELTGTMVVGTGGTIDVQMAQNTSNGSNTIALIGASAQFTRIA